MPTKQSSTGWGGKSSRAVDGNTNGHYGVRTSTHSRAKKNNWWQVDLLHKYPIHLVVIHNRWDCCQKRIDGAEVWVGKKKCGTVKYLPGVHVYPINCKGAKGRIIKVVQKKNYLTLAEVQVIMIKHASFWTWGLSHNFFFLYLIQLHKN